MPAIPGSVLALISSLLFFFTSACSRAQAFESFTLEEGDALIVEAPGCYSECRPSGPSRRICTLKDFDCRAVCQIIPECKTTSARPVKACAVVRTRR